MVTCHIAVSMKDEEHTPNIDLIKKHTNLKSVLLCSV